MSSIAPHIEAFLRQHLAHHRGASQHTCDSYAYSFQSLFEFAARKLKTVPSALTMEQLDAGLIAAFLEHLEKTRQNSAQTRNIRLAAIRSFFRFLQHRDPAALGPQCASIRVLGKGRRERALPLWKPTASALRAWLALRGNIAALEVFVNARGDPFSRWGVAYVLRCHADTASQTCPSLIGKPLSPHVLRHTSAMIVLQATQDIRKVSLWLGHSTLATTEIYVRADPTQKLEAIEAVVPPQLRKGKFRPPDKLIALLKSKS